MAGHAVRRTASLPSAYAGHPRLSCLVAAKTWMPGTSPGMTSGAFPAMRRVAETRDPPYLTIAIKTELPPMKATTNAPPATNC
jgi:hypothetical protein